METIDYVKCSKKLTTINKQINVKFKKTKNKDKFSDNWERLANSLIGRYDKRIIDAITDGNNMSASALKGVADRNYYANGTEQVFIKDAINDWALKAKALK